VTIGTHSSPLTPSPVGVSQGSVLGPRLFSIHTSPISTIAQSQHVSQQQYADDMQIFLALSPANHTQSISVLQSCLNSLHTWFCENGMAVNPNKSVAILFSKSERLKCLSGLKSFNVAGAVIHCQTKVKILGATLDGSLTMAPHVKALSSSCFYHIRSFRHSHYLLTFLLRNRIHKYLMFFPVDPSGSRSNPRQLSRLKLKAGIRRLSMVWMSLPPHT